MADEAIALPPDIEAAVTRALQEDLGIGDLTADLIDRQVQATARVVVRHSSVLCGTAWFDEVFGQLDARITSRWFRCDGDLLASDTTVCELTGPARAILSGERTALNFLQVLSGTATATREYADAIAGTGTRILDTRKTLPGLRLAQKYAVRCGGGKNHRIGLYDGILIKENHIAAAGTIRAAAEAAREAATSALVEVEVETIDELREALDTAVDRIMLDNFSLEDLSRAVTLRNASEGRRIDLEASGGIDLQSVRAVAKTGVDFISVGAITKNITAVDFSMRFS
jgi:nicotinate-nucleotide pyrophosphorylase (carboxylating)